ncbi:MAG: ABC transporter ATP-binding protein [Burkholderiales bacterium]
MTAGLELKSVGVWIDANPILRQVDLSVAQGECVALLGPSGCGKTTTLRTVAGFIQPQEGEVFIAGKPANGLPPNMRNVGLVFQDYALFPHMTIGENVGYGLRMRRVPKDEASRRVDEALDMVQLHAVRDRYPANLSGGQRQRVALARALVIRPDILLLDEPLGALDRKLRDRMQVELRQLQRHLGITTIIVTHDQEEALSLADRVAVMFEGSIREIGAPAALYERPSSREVMDFLGISNWLPADIIGTREDGRVLVQTAGIQIALPLSATVTGARVDLGLRPEYLRFVALDETGECLVDASIVECVYKGGLVEVHVRLQNGQRLIARSGLSEVTTYGLDRLGEKVRLRIDPDRLPVFSAS